MEQDKHDEDGRSELEKRMTELGERKARVDEQTDQLLTLVLRMSARVPGARLTQSS